jgi:hypothetical protein
VLSLHNTRRAKVVSFYNEAAMKRNFPIVSAITTFDLPIGSSVLLVVHEGSPVVRIEMKGIWSIN